jgi:hypothetical protein
MKYRREDQQVASRAGSYLWSPERNASHTESILSLSAQAFANAHQNRGKNIRILLCSFIFKNMEAVYMI